MVTQDPKYGVKSIDWICHEEVYETPEVLIIQPVETPPTQLAPGGVILTEGQAKGALAQFSMVIFKNG